MHEQICRPRAVESTPGGRSQEGKTTVAIHQEVAQEVQTRLQVIFGALGERTLRWTWKPSRWPCAVHYRHCHGVDFDIGEGWTRPSTPQANTSNATMKPTDAGRFL